MLAGMHKPCIAALLLLLLMVQTNPQCPGTLALHNIDAIALSSAVLSKGEDLILITDADVVGLAALNLNRTAVDSHAGAGLLLLHARNARELEEEGEVATALGAPPVLCVAEGILTGILRVAGTHDEAAAVGRRC